MDAPVCCEYDATTIDMMIDVFDVGSDTIGRTSGRRDDLQPAMFHVEGIDTNDGQTMIDDDNPPENRGFVMHRKTGNFFLSPIFAPGTQDQRGVLEDILRLA